MVKLYYASIQIMFLTEICDTAERQQLSPALIRRFIFLDFYIIVIELGRYSVRKTAT